MNMLNEVCAQADSPPSSGITTAQPSDQVTAEMLALMKLLEPYMLTGWRPKLRAPGSSGAVLEGMCQFTPDLAHVLLCNHNPRNRRIGPKKVMKLRNAMREGRWNPDLPDSTGVFGRDGNVKNFQHRLTACEAEEIDFVSRVEIGHDEDILIHLDQTEPRTEDQQARILGRDPAEKDNYAAVKFLWQLQNQKTHFPFERGGKTFDLIDSVYPREIWEIVPRKLIGDTTLVYPIRAALLLLAITWPNEVREFIRQIVEMQWEKDSGPYRLFHYMVHCKAKFSTEKQTYEGRMTMVRRTLKAFHLFLDGETITELRSGYGSTITLMRRIDPAWVIVADGPFDPNRIKRRTKKNHVDADDGDD